MPEVKLEKGWAKSRLILQLAQGELTQAELAREHGVERSTVSRFAERHRDEIEHQRSKITDEWAGIWIADKRNRVAEYQSDVEAINDALTSVSAALDDAEQDEKALDEKLLRAKLAIMRQVAEELGQLKEQIEVSGKLTYVVHGVDLSRLQ